MREVPSIFLAAGAVLARCRAAGRAGARSALRGAAVTFARDIEPIFEKSCWNCHSADAQLADLDLSTREAAIRGGEHGAAIVPGNAEQEPLVPHGCRARKHHHADGRLEAAAGGDRGHQERGSTAAPNGARRRRRLQSRRPPAASSALAALENMDITPEQRAYWAFKLPVQAPLPASRSIHAPDRSLPRKRARREGRHAGAARRSPHADSPRVSRSDRTAADAGAGAGVPRRQVAGCVDASHRRAARVAALR